MERPANVYHTTPEQYHTIILEDKRYNSLPGPCRAQLTRPQHPSLPDRQIRAGCIGRTFAYNSLFDIMGQYCGEMLAETGSFDVLLWYWVLGIGYYILYIYISIEYWVWVYIQYA